eukprot:5194416-Alexandrium_andersonii.AAC.1
MLRAELLRLRPSVWRIGGLKGRPARTQRLAVLGPKRSGVHPRVARACAQRAQLGQPAAAP